LRVRRRCFLSPVDVHRRKNLQAGEGVAGARVNSRSGCCSCFAQARLQMCLLCFDDRADFLRTRASSSCSCPGHRNIILCLPTRRCQPPSDLQRRRSVRPLQPRPPHAPMDCGDLPLPRRRGAGHGCRRVATGSNPTPLSRSVEGGRDLSKISALVAVGADDAPRRANTG